MMNCRAVMMAIVLVMMWRTRVSDGQDLPACATNVEPCREYINMTTKPPSSCCDPLSQAVVKQLSCLCNLYTTPSFFESFSINFTQVIRLPSLCGIATDLTTCIGRNNQTSSFPASLAPPKNNNDSSTKNEAIHPSENNTNRSNQLTWLLVSSLLVLDLSVFLLISMH